MTTDTSLVYVTRTRITRTALQVPPHNVPVDQVATSIVAQVQADPDAYVWEPEAECFDITQPIRPAPLFNPPVMIACAVAGLALSHTFGPIVAGAAVIAGAAVLIWRPSQLVHLDRPRFTVNLATMAIGATIQMGWNAWIRLTP